MSDWIKWAVSVLVRFRHQNSDDWVYDGFEVRQYGGLMPPTVYDEFEAIAIAEAYERLDWSTGQPKLPGLYWLKVATGHVVMDEVTEDEIRLGRSFAGLFAGPIPEPVEPEGGE